MEVDEECLTAVAAPSIIPLLSAPKTREPHWQGQAMHESWPFPLGLQQQEHDIAFVTTAPRIGFCGSTRQL